MTPPGVLPLFNGYGYSVDNFLWSLSLHDSSPHHVAPLALRQTSQHDVCSPQRATKTREAAFLLQPLDKSRRIVRASHASSPTA